MYEYNLTVEFEDIDSYGIIHHPKILYYLERARTHFLLDNGLNIKSIKEGIVLRDVSIQYKAQILMFDKLTVQVRVRGIEKYKFYWDYIIKKDGKTMITSSLEVVIIDLESKKLTPIPEYFLKIIKQIEIDDKKQNI